MRSVTWIWFGCGLLLAACDPTMREICQYHTDCDPCYKCDNGSCALDEDALNACGGCGEVLEVCDNGSDDDCDGQTDEGCDDPCAGVTCDTPPGPDCQDADTLRVFRNPGACQEGSCEYGFDDVNCPGGCQDDDCVGNPCQGVTCDSPPAPVCINADLRRSYTSPGTCDLGVCAYPSSEETCPHGCQNGACQGAPGALQADPVSLEFGDLIIGCAAQWPQLSTEICNHGSQAETITDIFFEGYGASAFSLRSAGSTPFSLTAGSCFTLTVAFQPTMPGVFNALLVVEYSERLEIPLTASALESAPVTDTILIPEETPVDILWIVENSGSMSMTLPLLVDALDAFVAELDIFQLDFHLGVIATEVNQTVSGGTPPRDIIPGVLVQAPGRPKVVTNLTPQTVTAFTENFDMGACCSEMQEAGLQAAWMALSPSYLSDPAKNAGFLRDEARLVLVVAGDEDDQSVETAAYYADFFRSLKAERGSDWIRFFAITSPLPEGCGEYPASAKYAEAADALGGGVYSICLATSAEFEIVMQNIVASSANPLDTFRLSQEPDPESIGVTVGGDPVPEASSFRGPDGWTYLPSVQELYLGSNVTPPRGVEVVISYRGVCP